MAACVGGISPLIAAVCLSQTLPATKPNALRDRDCRYSMGLQQVQVEWSAVKGASSLAGEDPAQGVVGTPW